MLYDLALLPEAQCNVPCYVTLGAMFVDSEAMQ